MSKTDKELLKLAAKAINLNAKPLNPFTGFYITGKGIWNPLESDGDAFRLAFDLDMDVSLSQRDKEVTAFTLSCGAVSSYTEAYSNDKYAATRRAIVRAAADIGEAMQ